MKLLNDKVKIKRYSRWETIHFETLALEFATRLQRDELINMESYCDGIKIYYWTTDDK